MAFLVCLFADFDEGEIEKLNLILTILNLRAPSLDLPPLRQLIIERQSLVVATRESIFEEWSVGDLAIGDPPVALGRG